MLQQKQVVKSLLFNREIRIEKKKKKALTK